MVSLLNLQNVTYHARHLRFSKGIENEENVQRIEIKYLNNWHDSCMEVH